MRSLLAVLLMCSSAVADEQREELVAPESSTCKPNGAVWFELANLDSRLGTRQETTRLYANGTVTTTSEVKEDETNPRYVKKEGVQVLRCWSPEAMELIQAQLAQLADKAIAVKREARCKSTKTTTIKVYDKVMFTQRACDKVGLDRKTAAALAKVRGVLKPSPRTDCTPFAKGC